jgi:hypothetical protein
VEWNRPARWIHGEALIRVSPILRSRDGSSRRQCAECAGHPSLAATKLRVSNLLSQVPDYTCLERIERDSQDPRAGRHRDVVRVDVVLVGGKESFSWPGQATPSTHHLRSLIGYGLTATGLFGGLAHNLFVGTGPVICPAARETLDGLPALRYDFSVPATASAWTVYWSVSLAN